MKIGEIANKTNLPASTLRYYEKKGLLKVDRDKNGRRYYKESDIEWIKFIRRLKETGMLIKDIQHYSELRYVGSITMPERLQILQLHRNYGRRKKKNGKEKTGFIKTTSIVKQTASKKNMRTDTRRKGSNSNRRNLKR